MASSAPRPISSDDPRMGEVIQKMTLEQFVASQQQIASAATPAPCVAVTGFPYDEGCRRNGGRVGAAGGPAVARGFMQKMGTVVNPELSNDSGGLDLNSVTHVDVGDVAPDLASLEEAHVALQQRVAALLAAGPHVIPFVIGGSNDQSYPNAAALMSTLAATATAASSPTSAAAVVPSIGVINIDAHLDVRPLKDGLAHSGSPFRQLLEDPRFFSAGSNAAAASAAAAPRSLRFVEFAAQGNQCSQSHADFVTRTHGQQIRWLSDLRSSIARNDYAAASATPAAAASASSSSVASPAAAETISQRGMAKQFLDTLNSLQADHLFVSFDLDAVTGADAPGVSCPGSIGLSAEEALSMCFVAGAHPRVRLFDLSEFNPRIDDYRTGRLVCNMWYFFCAGVASRRNNKTK